MQTALYIAAALVLIVALAHSYLGERYLLARLFRNNTSKILDSNGFAGRTLRFAWHITSIAWLGFAALLVLLALGRATPAAIAAVIVDTWCSNPSRFTWQTPCMDFIFGYRRASDLRPADLNRFVANPISIFYTRSAS
jgi:hypothetical protein